jgi:hypothetical protein
MASDAMIRSYDYDPFEVYRHEIGHCNGWGADHFGSPMFRSLGSSLEAIEGKAIAVLKDMDGKPIVDVYFSENTSQEVLHHHCPQVSADKGMIACAVVFEAEPIPRCYILFATNKVVQQHSKLSRLDIIAENMGNCIRIVDKTALSQPIKIELK